MSVCSEDGCSKAVSAIGLCSTHYMRLRRAGLVPVGTRARGTLEERFWRYVEPSEDCWKWVGGSRNQRGYGQIQMGGKGSPFVLAHRLSYEIHHGLIPDGMVVMHMCDNPSCVNPSHLRVGSASENVRDAFNKGRRTSTFKTGAAHHAAVLDAEKVKYIRANKQVSQTKMAKQLGCSRSAVAAVLEGRTWTHIDNN